MSKGLAKLVLGWSRDQLGVTWILGALLLGLLVWRAWPPGAPPEAPRPRWFIEVAGEVPRPGVYMFEAPPTLAAALEQAGGPAPPPEMNSPTLSSGTKITVAGGGTWSLGRLPGPQLLTLGLAVDLNTASAADLAALPGIGPALAQRIVVYREEHGPFGKIEDLLSVKGIGEKSLDRLKEYIFIDLSQKGLEIQNDS